VSLGSRKGGHSGRPHFEHDLVGNPLHTFPDHAPASAQYAVFLEPGLRLLPGIFRGVLAVAAAIIGMEAVRRFRIERRTDIPWIARVPDLTA
jgi:hypothetical protein